MYRNKEYAAARNLIALMVITEVNEYERILVRRMISPRRLIEGGAAIFAAENINHQKVMAGNSIVIPFVMNMLRV